MLNGIQLNLAVLSGQVSAHQRLITGDDGGGQRIFDLLFDQAAQIAGAVLDRVGLLGEQAEQAVVPRQADILVGQRGAQLTEHDLSNMAEVILGQLVERDNLVCEETEFTRV